jgi:hypothetical protein
MIKRKSVASDLGNARAILARAEQVVDVLRTRYVCQCWKLDEEAAARMLRYFRRKAAGAPDNDEVLVVAYRSRRPLGSQRGPGPTVLQAKYDRLLGISSRPAAPERQEAA